MDPFFMNCDGGFRGRFRTALPLFLVRTSESVFVMFSTTGLSPPSAVWTYGRGSNESPRDIATRGELLRFEHRYWSLRYPTLSGTRAVQWPAHLGLDVQYREIREELQNGQLPRGVRPCAVERDRGSAHRRHTFG